MTGKRRSRKLGLSKLDSTNRVRQMLAQLLDVATSTLRDLADEAGVSYFAIRSYRRGAHMPSSAVLKRLAAAMRARGGQVAKAAATLERLAREQGRTPQPRGKP